MSDYLPGFKPKIKAFIKANKPIIDQGILLWKIITHIIYLYKKDHEDWLFLRHEDISRNPLINFQKIFDYLDLEFDERTKARIKKYTFSKNPNMSSGKKANSLKLDSRSNISSWKKRLSAEEIEYIKENVQDFSKKLYPPHEW